ncbi:MAG: hypothetical protein ACE366_31420 [Bradymonadia bacterium]
MKRFITPITFSLALLGCQDAPEAPTTPETPEDAQIMLSVRTLSTEGRVLEMVPFAINGQRYGITGADGEFWGPMTVKNGDEIALSADLLSGYRALPGAEVIRETITLNEGRPTVVSMTLRLAPPAQDYLVLTRLGQPEVEVKLNGEVIGQTDKSGRAMLNISGRPDMPFLLQAGGLAYRGRFAREHEVYVIAEGRMGPMSALERPGALARVNASRPASGDVKRRKKSLGHTSTPQPPREIADVGLPIVEAAPDAGSFGGPPHGREPVEQCVVDARQALSVGEVLKKEQVGCLEQVAQGHTRFGEAQRLLGHFYFKIKDTQQQIKALELATARGQLKHDPAVLLSLAEAYARSERFEQSLRTLRRVDRLRLRLPKSRQAATFALRGECNELLFARQFHDDPEAADVALLDDALEAWTKLASFHEGHDASARADALARVRKLQEMQLELQP